MPSVRLYGGSRNSGGLKIWGRQAISLGMATATLPTNYSIDDRSEDGPEMAALPDAFRQFVLLYISTNMDEEQCARAAGLANQAKGRSRMAPGAAVMRSPKVLAAMREETTRRLAGSAAVGLRVLLEIANSKGHKDQLKAARELLAHAGLAPTKEHKLTVEHTGARPEELKAEIRQLMAQIGPDANRLLTNAGLEVIDAEFTEVPKDENGEEW